jgi:hypothetical protein
MMNKKECKECGEKAVVIHDDWLHLCSPCWIDKFVKTGGKNDRQSNSKIRRANNKTLQSS